MSAAAATAAPLLLLLGQLQHGLSLPAVPRVPVAPIMEILEAFQDIASQTPENARCVATGYNASAEYIVNQLGGIGQGSYFDVEVQHFTVPIYKALTPPVLELPLSDPPVTFTQCPESTGWQHYVRDCDYAMARYGGQGGDVTARAAWVGEGCAAEDYADMAEGEIALMQNSGSVPAAERLCDNYEKAMLAESLGAAAIIFAGSIAPARVFQSTWRAGEATLTIPAIGVTTPVGAVLRQDGGQVAHVATDSVIDVLYTYNVFATTRVGEAGSTVMVGAHLDSVPEGPGINDNGSGSATLLAMANVLASEGTAFNNRVRFAWWGAEEVGLIGSRHYVRDLVENNPPEFDNLALYLNFDMDASPNYVRRVNTCENAPSCVDPTATANSMILTELLEAGFARMGLPSVGSPMTGGSDFYPFVLAGVPASGLATGAGGIKTAAERDVHGGLALAQLDPCYHAPCDSTANIALDCLAETADLAYRTLLELGSSIPFGGKRQALAGDSEATERLLALLGSEAARPAVESCSGADEEEHPDAPVHQTRMHVHDEE